MVAATPARRAHYASPPPHGNVKMLLILLKWSLTHHTQNLTITTKTTTANNQQFTVTILTV